MKAELNIAYKILISYSDAKVSQTVFLPLWNIIDFKKCQKPSETKSLEDIYGWILRTQESRNALP